MCPRTAWRALKMVLQDLLLSLPVIRDVSQALLSHQGQPWQQWMGWPCPSPPLQEGYLESEPALGDGVVLLPLVFRRPSLPSGCHIASPVGRRATVEVETPCFPLWRGFLATVNIPNIKKTLRSPSSQLF